MRISICCMNVLLFYATHVNEDVLFLYTNDSRYEFSQYWTRQKSLNIELKLM